MKRINIVVEKCGKCPFLSFYSNAYGCYYNKEKVIKLNNPFEKDFPDECPLEDV